MSALDDARTQLRALMAAEKVSQRELARRLGVAQGSLTGLFGGEAVSVDRLERAVAALGGRLIVVVAKS